MIILGLNVYHGDSSASLLKDGEILCAFEEERFTRFKHWAGFPLMSIRYCIEQAGLTLADIDYIAVNNDPKANLIRKGIYTLRHRPNPALILIDLKIVINGVPSPRN